MYRYNRGERFADVGVLLALATCVILWASAYPGIRVGLGGYSPAHLAVLRFLVASVTLASFAAVMRMRLPDVIDLPGLVLAGTLGIVIYHLLLNAGELTVSAGAASFLANTIPVFTAVLAWLFLKERLPALGWAGIAVSLCGVALIAAGDVGGFQIDRGVLLILGSSASGAGYFILQKHFMKKYTAFEFTAYAIWAGTLVLLLFSRGLGEAIRLAPIDATAAAVYLGIFPAAIGYVAWGRVLAAWSASKAATALFLVPGVSLVISWAWLGEVPTLLSLVGGFLALAGVGLVRSSGVSRASGKAAQPSREYTSADGAEERDGTLEWQDDDCRGRVTSAAGQPC
jgi:drug/metabolite transporter (DMT)-like permease